MFDFFQIISAKITAFVTVVIVTLTSILPGPASNIDNIAGTSTATPSATVSESPKPTPTSSPTVIKSPSISAKPTPSIKPVKTEAEIKLEQVSKELEEIKKSNEESKKQADKDAVCRKADDLSEGLPSGMPVKHVYNPADKSIKGYLDFYKDQAQQEYARNLPADTKFGNWIKVDGISGATVDEIKNTVSYLEQKHNEYLEAKNSCGV